MRVIKKFYGALTWCCCSHFLVIQISYFGKRPNDEINGKNLLTYRPGITVLHTHTRSDYNK